MVLQSTGLTSKAPSKWANTTLGVNNNLPFVFWALGTHLMCSKSFAIFDFLSPLNTIQSAHSYPIILNYDPSTRTTQCPYLIP